MDAGKGEPTLIPFSSIIVDTGYSLRADCSADEVLVASIQKEGLWTPLKVVRGSDENGLFYKLVSGFRRHSAIRELCRRDSRFVDLFAEVPVLFVDSSDRMTLAKLILKENMR